MKVGKKEKKRKGKVNNTTTRKSVNNSRSTPRISEGRVRIETRIDGGLKFLFRSLREKSYVLFPVTNE